MTIQSIGSTCITLFIDQTDLAAHGLEPKTLNLAQAKRLAEEAFIEAGINPSGGLEIEAFPNTSGVLVFARLMSLEPVFFSFDDFESVIRAAKSMSSDPPPSMLTYIYGKYVLTVLCIEKQPAVCSLNDYGTQIDTVPKFTAHLREHGKTLIGASAIKFIAENF